MSKIERAILSVTDKSGLIEFARKLIAQQVELVSTGGTAKLLREDWPSGQRYFRSHGIP